MEVIDSRLARAFEEAKGMPEYDYILVNDQLEKCVTVCTGSSRASMTEQRTVRSLLKR